MRRFLPVWEGIYFQSVPDIANNAFPSVDAEKLTVYYSGACDLTALQNAIEGSGMKGVDLKNNIPAFESDPTLAPLTYLLGL